ncbi:MAG TPA: hypothetical protein VKJ07_24615, partial [Mycobacteriales bacterium]|nr:hypothetical protein [Mycobacteriales bacterium]
MDALLACVGLLAVLHVLYSTWTARRLDRLHARVDAATAALDRQLRYRAEAALAFAPTAAGSAGRDLTAAATAALEVAGLGHDREAAESALSRALQSVHGDVANDGANDAPNEGHSALADVMTRAVFARRFHNDAVRDALTVRRRRIVRWFRLAGTARLPSFFEMD